jgi:hypothetical protein
MKRQLSISFVSEWLCTDGMAWHGCKIIQHYIVTNMKLKDDDADDINFWHHIYEWLINVRLRFAQISHQIWEIQEFLFVGICRV